MFWLSACVHSAPAGGQAPEAGQCLRLLALNEGGGAAILDEGTPRFVGEDRGMPVYHLTRVAADDLQSLPRDQCIRDGLCAQDGSVRAQSLGLQPAAAFRVGRTGAPGQVTVDLPGHGIRTLSLTLRENRFGKPEWMVTVDREKDPWVLYRAPEALAPRAVEWFRAGDHLWLQVESSGEGLSCAVATANLRDAAAGMLDDAAVDSLRDAKYEQARALLEKALEVKPEDATAAYNLACTLALMGQPDAAMIWLERAFLNDDENRLRQLARRDPDLESLWTREDFLFLVAP